MSDLLGSVDNRDGEAFLTAAIIVFTVVAACCSSPQTAEINADQRAETLMKWVKLGMGTSALFVGTVALYDRKHTKEYLAGGAMAAGVMYAFYAHAKVSGLASSEPSTEQPPAQSAQ